MSIAENYETIKEQTGNYNVEIIAVTKYASSEQILEAYKSGVRNFAENYIQDAIKKIDDLFPYCTDVKWHLVGRLQKNKIKFAVGRFYLIQSVDSEELAEFISTKAKEKGLIQDILLQVNVLNDPTKAGFNKLELEKNIDKLINLENIKVKGLMTIAPKTSDEIIIRECFSQVRDLKNKFNLKELSIGMTNDYKIALEYGASMIRIGRGIFQN